MHRHAWVLFATLALAACQVVPTRPLEAPRVAEPARREAWTPQALDVVATPRLADVVAFVDTLPVATTLVVFDIDDTLLGAPHANGRDGTRRFFGSDAWYNWQAALGDDDPDKLPKPCLYDFLALNYEADVQVPTEPDAAQRVRDIRTDRILLTSRSPAYRGGTERELRANGFPAIRQLTMKPNVFVRSPDGVPMTYIDGIYMTQGADKGEALFALLRKLGIERKYTHVVLVDDGWKNITSLHAAAAARNVRYKGFLYTGIKHDPNAPDAGPAARVDAAAARSAWSAWLEGIGRMYPERGERLAKECSKGR